LFWAYKVFIPPAPQNCCIHIVYFIFFKDFIYLFETERMRERAHEKGEGQREKQVPAEQGVKGPYFNVSLCNKYL